MSRVVSRIFRPPDASWPLSWPILVPSWPDVRTILAYPGPSWRHLGTSWPHLGLLWCHLGLFPAHLGAILAQLRPQSQILVEKSTPRPPKIIDFPSVFIGFFDFQRFQIYVDFWSNLGRILGSFWFHLGPSWRHVGPMLSHLGPSWLHLVTILAHLGPSWPI